MCDLKFIYERKWLTMAIQMNYFHMHNSLHFYLLGACCAFNVCYEEKQPDWELEEQPRLEKVSKEYNTHYDFYIIELCEKINCVRFHDAED